MRKRGREREKEGERREGKEEEEKKQQLLLEFYLGCFFSGAVHLVFKF